MQDYVVFVRCHQTIKLFTSEWIVFTRLFLMLSFLSSIPWNHYTSVHTIMLTSLPIRLFKESADILPLYTQTVFFLSCGGSVAERSPMMHGGAGFDPSSCHVDFVEDRYWVFSRDSTTFFIQPILPSSSILSLGLKCLIVWAKIVVRS